MMRISGVILMNMHELKKLYMPEPVSREALLSHIQGLRFGVEIEFAGLTEREAAEKVFKAMGGHMYDRREKDNGDRFFDPFAVDKKRQFDVKINGMRYGFDRDTTINADKCAELVTSPMRLDKASDLMAAVHVLNQNGAYATPTAATHIHLDASHEFDHNLNGFENPFLRILCNSFVNRAAIGKMFPISAARMKFCEPYSVLELMGMLHSQPPELSAMDKTREIAVRNDYKTIELRRFAFDIDMLGPQIDFALSLGSCSVLGVKLPPAYDEGVSERESVGVWLDYMGVPKASIQKLGERLGEQLTTKQQATGYMERYDSFSHGAEISKVRGLTNPKGIAYNEFRKGDIR